MIEYNVEYNNANQLSLDRSFTLCSDEENDTANSTLNSDINSLSQKELLNIFKGSSNSLELEKPYINEEIYFTESYLNDKTKTKVSEIQSVTPTPKSNLFNVINTPKNNDIQLGGKKRKRGRQVEEPYSGDENNQKVHDKFSTDNLLRKIQVHYISFLINCMNLILKELNYKQEFLKLDYNFKKNVNKDVFESLKNKKISEIICNKISNKYRIKDKFVNFKIYHQIKDDNILKNIFNENYFYFFKNYYYKSVKSINLKKYGLEKEIILSKDVKTYKDLLEYNKDNDINNNQYIENMNLCVCQNYLNNKFLMC